MWISFKSIKESRTCRMALEKAGVSLLSEQVGFDKKPLSNDIDILADNGVNITAIIAKYNCIFHHQKAVSIVTEPGVGQADYNKIEPQTWITHSM